ncbi:hypothetical protein EQG41_05610 [Billgrantia azerbaijanica]|nr:hypothetical protein EQG41_05610 [Halomonas azerbaijanica]
MHGYRVVGSAMLSLAMVLMGTSGAQAAGGFLDELDGTASTQAVWATDLPGFARPGVEVIETSVMAELRGGFSINGLDLDFGARLQSMIDDVLYQTMVEFTDMGTKVLSQTLVDPAGNAVEINPATAGNIAEATPVGISLPGFEQFSGVAVNDAKGFSAVLHTVTGQAIVGGVVSDAAGRSIGNQVNIDITVNNIEALRNLGIQSRIANALSR